ncbi:MAG: dihydrolipoamide acetyltransferase family protein [Betaproteobacteria bacterium]
MGIHVIKMPDIGEGIAEVELVAWHVKVGDIVEEDQTLVDVMTDKATVEIPSSAAGKVLALGGVVGEVLAVGAEVIRIEVDGPGNLKAGPVVAGKAAADRKPAAKESPKAPMEMVKPAAKSVAAASAPMRRDAPVTPSARKPGDKPIASPATRRRAWEAGIELQFVPGSGPAGRIMQEDLDAFIARGDHGSPAGRRDQRYAERHDEIAVPVIGLRRKIAQKMQESKRHIPHFTYVEEVDVTDLETLRAQLNRRWEQERGRLTMLPFLMRAIVLAVREFPQVNARYDDEADVVTRHGAVHLGIATQTEAGLMVPVVRHAEARDLWASATEVARLAEAARSGKATREELSGSTITITSLGALGGIVTTPVINRPEVAIVGVNRQVVRPVWQGGQFVPRTMMNLSSSFDHRVVDGYVAARFIQRLKGLLEAPATIFIEE